MRTGFWKYVLSFEGYVSGVFTSYSHVNVKLLSAKITSCPTSNPAFVAFSPRSSIISPVSTS